MKFGPVPLDDALGAILAHSVQLERGRLRKGSALSAGDIAALRAAGHREVTVARLDGDDLSEDAAALTLARALCGPGLTVQDPFTGRANLHADGPGILQVDPAAIDAINGIDPALTVATLPEWQRLTPGMMAATVKIIPYAVPCRAVEAATALAPGALRRHAPGIARAELIVTTLPGAPLKSDAVHTRLTRFGVTCEEIQVPHGIPPLVAALKAGTAPLRLILTASATSDGDDVGPAAVREAGGEVIRVGMPVDPGNLLFLAHLGGAHVIGLPGCARSPALNGADWVLERILCGQRVTARDIASMGVGGLLGEIPTRPQPRDKKD